MSPRRSDIWRHPDTLADAQKRQAPVNAGDIAAAVATALVTAAWILLPEILAAIAAMPPR